MPNRSRLLTWTHTWPEGDGPHDDYTGTNPAFPRLYARIYLTPTGTYRDWWYWTLAEQGPVSSGYQPDLERAVTAAEAAYAIWRHSKRQG
jgi:hypothetical protein